MLAPYCNAQDSLVNGLRFVINSSCSRRRRRRRRPLTTRRHRVYNSRSPSGWRAERLLSPLSQNYSKFRYWDIARRAVSALSPSRRSYVDDSAMLGRRSDGVPAVTHTRFITSSSIKRGEALPIRCDDASDVCDNLKLIVLHYDVISHLRWVYNLWPFLSITYYLLAMLPTLAVGVAR